MGAQIKTSIIALFLLAAVNLLGQDRIADSLHQELISAHSDSLKIRSLMALGNYFQNKALYDSARYFYQQALRSAELSPFRGMEGNINRNLGFLFGMHLSEFDSAIVHSQKAYDILIALGRPKEAAQSLIGQGNALMNQGLKTEASQIFTNAARINTTSGNDSLNDRIFINLGTLYLQLGDDVKHEHYIRKGRAIAQLYGNTRNLTITNMALAAINRKKKNLDSTLLYSQEALNLSRKLNDLTLIAYSYLNLANGEEALGHIEKAERYFLQIYNLRGLSPFDHARFTYFLGRFYAQNERYRKAEKYLQEALTDAQVLEAKDLQINIISRLLPAQEELGHYKSAYFNASEMIKLMDEVHNKEIHKEVEAINVKFETEKKEKEILSLQATNAHQEVSLLTAAARANRRFWWGITATLSLLVLGTTFLIFRKNSIHREKMAEREAALQKEKLFQVTQEGKNMALRAMLKGEELERTRMAQELHDGIGIMLSSLKLSLERGDSTDRPNPYKLVDRASSELRRVAQNMMPEALMKFGLMAAIEDLCDEINFNQKLQVTVQQFGMDKPIFDTVALQIYRTLQEVLNNIIKHAEATEVLVQLIQRNKRLFITVEDNGKGFTPSAYRGPGHGLRNINSRINYLNGKLSWDSSPGKGTTVSIEVKLTRQDDQVIHH